MERLKKKRYGEEKLVPQATGIIFDIDHFAVHDGPGIRTAVYFKGCPLRCRWCHSPESQHLGVELLYIQSRCSACGRCVEACPSGCQQLEEGQGRRYVRCECIRCGRCAAACPASALELCGRRVSVDEVLGEVREQLPFFRNSGGGVTLTGGEVLYQPHFLKELVAGLKDQGIHTLVETSGWGSWEVLAHLASLVDTFYYDLKVMEPWRHLRYTRRGNRRILTNLAHLRDHTRQIVVRIPLIPGYTDSTANVRAIYEVMGRLQLSRAHLLPYNDSAPEKYSWLGRSYPPGELQGQSSERLAELQDLAPAGIEVAVIGGNEN